MPSDPISLPITDMAFFTQRPWFVVRRDLRLTIPNPPMQQGGRPLRLAKWKADRRAIYVHPSRHNVFGEYPVA